MLSVIFMVGLLDNASAAGHNFFADFCANETLFCDMTTKPRSRIAKARLQKVGQWYPLPNARRVQH
jgi:hypothetical protein